MDKSARNLIQKATQDARRLIEAEFGQQLEGLFDILPNGTIATGPGKHLDATQRFIRQKIVATIKHEKASGSSDSEAVDAYLREASFTYLNRFVALKMLEARGLTQECVSRGEQSSGFKEFSGLAPGLAELPDRGYRLYVESLFDELSLEIRVLFDRQNPASLLWPQRKIFDELLSILNREEIGDIWSEDETIGWIYQYFNSGEERKKMRDESAAPRNSRELAVRNQFFTPRYVVEFLTDNTLGRIWYEMRKGDTVLKDECKYFVKRPNEIFLTFGEKAPGESENEMDLSKEGLLNKNIYIEHRPKKDPRDMLVLDPACGSGHFLLYAFNLLERIYEEAWEDPESPKFEATGRTLRADFETLEGLRQAIPKLIIEHNLHGIDIDPRSVQIAALALWLLAQKTWKKLGIKTTDRLQVVKSNIVTAESMPGEEDILREFTADLKPRVLGQLVDVVFDKMKFAGEAGSLLKIEEEIKDTVAKAKEQWLEGPKPGQQFLFPEVADPRPKQQELRFDFEGVTYEHFWEKAEDRILNALKDYAERTENGHAIRCRLFAQDAARGFAFIDLCRKRYDVVLMNPPYGAPPVGLTQYLKNNYTYTSTDLYAAFLVRVHLLMANSGLAGAITDRSFLMLPTFKNLRKRIVLKEMPVTVLADLWYGVLDGALNRTAAYILTKEKRTYPSVFFNLRFSEDKNADLLYEINELLKGNTSNNINLHRLDIFRLLPGSRIAHWASKGLIYKFREPLIEPALGFVRAGIQTCDDFQFIRYWYEIHPSGISHELKGEWAFLAKGGELNPYGANMRLVVRYGDHNRIASFIEYSIGRQASRHIQNRSSYGIGGYTFALVSEVFYAQFMPKGAVFSIAGQGILTHNMLGLSGLALLNSSLSQYYLGLLSGGHRWDGKCIASLPFGNFEPNVSIETLAAKISDLQCLLDGIDECSVRFKAPLLDKSVQNKEVLSEVAIAQNTIDEAIFETLQIDQDGRDDVRKFCLDEGIRPFRLRNRTENLEPSGHFISIISYCLGVIFGRWDIRLAIEPSLFPKLPDSFAPPPICPPGMLVGSDCLPAESGCIVSEEWLRARPNVNTFPSKSAVKKSTILNSDYLIRISWDGILVDDPGFAGEQLHGQDIAPHTREVLGLIWKDKAHEVEREACEILKVSDLRYYFRKSFFKDHIKRYSKSRRKAPIYWQLSTPSASYSIWLYYHRVTKDTFYKVLNEYVLPKLQFEERELTNIRQQYGFSSTARQRKEILAREVFVAELTTFKEEIACITPLWNPDLNDGVIINFAPLWRLVPQNKPWQKECKKIWDKMVKGDYDWAHLAMHLWPERVVIKCAKDRSLAIAHGLDETFWEEDDKGKWKPRKVSQETVDSLVQERISPTVKAALEDLLKAPIPASIASKKRKKKA